MTKTTLTYKTKDRDKGITRIAYNNIGLVDSILFDTGAKVLYTYGINGEKLRVRHVAATSNMVSPLSHSPFPPISPGIDTSSYDDEEYIGGDFVVYGSVSGGASVVPSYKYYFGDGYISQDPVFLIGAGSNASYHYYSKDHLGNIRSVVTKSTFTNAVTEEQKTHYYPFGGIIADLSTGRNVQNRLYNGKELDTSNNLWWYDYGARQYDPTAPRFTTADPLAERNYNTDSYVYCGNNPVMRIDPDGRDWYEHTNDNNQKSAFWEDDNASSITIGEYTYENVGDTYTISYDWGEVNYNQQDIESIKFQGNSSSSMYEGFGKAAQAASLSSTAYTIAGEAYMQDVPLPMQRGIQVLGACGTVASALQIFCARNQNERNEAILDTSASIISSFPGMGFYVGGTYMMYKPIVEKFINTTNQLNQYLEYKFSTPESVGSIMQNGW